MLHDLIITCVLLLLFIIAWGKRDLIMGVLRRFDQTNIARQLDQEKERNDPQAHIRQTLKLAEEQVEDVSELVLRDIRTGTEVSRFVFQGEKFATRAEADQARAQAIGKIARHFYAELPYALAARDSDDHPKDKLN